MPDEAQGFVELPYGRVPGCPICGLIPLSKPLICEHGVTPAPEFEISSFLAVADRDAYRRLLGMPPPSSPDD